MARIRKAIFPVAGLGTRFLPATKAMPKEMLPIVDKPLIQYALEEADAAGIEQFIFVTGRGKTAIEDHFDHSIEVEHLLRERSSDTELESLRSIIMTPGSISYTRQQEPLGLGHAVWCARHYIQDEPFAVLLADDFIFGGPGCLQEMIDAYDTCGGNMAAVMDVPKTQVSKYGIMDVAEDRGHLVSATGVVEKPHIEDAPSTLAVIGRYILQPDIFTVLDGQGKGASGEIQLTDAIAAMLPTTPLSGVRFQGKRYDCGSKVGFLAANMAVGLAREDLRSDLLQAYKELLGAPTNAKERKTVFNA
ncbi:MAG: UTP--glucose-1-phosphate uridylyltransferase GalU [Alphaproteobacteria bacterium]|nr:UTP--glucose-1-phosphate uridylyltransferase GalU [Alphaproteobacteria bacterium]